MLRIPSTPANVLSGASQRQVNLFNPHTKIYITPLPLLNMALEEKQIKRLSIIAIIVLFCVVAFLIFRPIILPVIGGLIMAYVFYPLYNRLVLFLKSKNVSAFLALVVVILIIIAPIWFLVHIMTQQVFEIFRFSQTFEIHKLIETLFPTASSQFIVQLTTAFDTFISKTTSAILNNLVNVFLSLPKFLLNIFIVGFVCFFTLKDYDSLKGFMSEISPFGKSHENVVIKQFKRITDSVIYGQVVVGILHGVLAGVALILLNVPNSIVLTVVAIILSIVPFVGPAFVWIPTAIYLFYIGKSTTLLAIFVIYNLLIVSNIDNLVRAYIVSKKSEISSAIILVGMIGGLFMFGLLGLILGPLILAYFLVLLKSYKDNDLHNIFSD